MIGGGGGDSLCLVMEENSLCDVIGGGGGNGLCLVMMGKKQPLSWTAFVSWWGKQPLSCDDGEKTAFVL